MLGEIIAFLTVIVLILIKLLTRISTIGGGDPSALQRRVAKKYSKWRADPSRPSFRKFCYPTDYKVQRQQSFLGEYMDPSNGIRELIAFHTIGAGKTCAAIQVGLRYRNPLVMLPASLIGGFRAELRSPCAGDKYLTEDERRELSGLGPRDAKRRKIIAESDRRIDADWTIVSYNKFAEEGAGSHDIIIVDEVHNLANSDGAFYEATLAWIRRHPRASVLLMSATPIFDNPSELSGLAALLRINAQIITPEDIEKHFAGHISYFAGAPQSTYPRADVKYVQLAMSAHQARWYRSDMVAERNRNGDIRLDEAANNFYANTRQRANVAYPRGLIGDEGINALKSADIRERVRTYSCKMAYLQKRLRRDELTFIYSAYTGAGGIDLITRCLRAWGWQDYFSAGPGRRRYAVWSGDTSDSRRDEIREVFNDSANDDGSQISVVVGSPSIREGVSLLRVRRAHLIDLYWNDSRIDQIIGRVLRFCSHKTLPPAERSVEIYLYLAYTESQWGVRNSRELDAPPPPSDPTISIDAYMLGLAMEKKSEKQPFIDAMINAAVDRLL